MTKVIRHPKNGKPVYGDILPPGMRIQKGDVFTSSGGWANCSDELIGCSVPYNPQVVWVRPKGTVMS